WQAALGHRTRGRRGCPYCAGQKVSVTNSLASVYPSIADEWHPTKNGDLTPDKVVAGSNKKFWWRCPKAPDHEWQANLNSRTHRTHPAGCPFCRALKVSKTNSLASCFPKVAVEWNPTKNGDLTPDDVVSGSAVKVWWQCPNARDHEWQASVVKRTTEGQSCPY